MSIKAIESRDKAYDKQWLTYWVIYSFVTLIELSFAGIFYWYFLFVECVSSLYHGKCQKLVLMIFDMAEVIRCVLEILGVCLCAF